MKICTKCNIEKEESQFSKNKGYKDGLSHWCKECFRIYKINHRESHKEKIKANKHMYYEENKETLKEKNKKYIINNKDKIKLYYQENKEKITRQNRQYQKDNRCKRNNRQKERLESDRLFKLKRLIRNRINAALKNNNFTKSQRLDQYLGCTPEQLKLHLESQFYPNPETNEEMLWSNHGTYGWHIDHIVPLSSATTIEEIYKLSHYTNLQPLWAKENLSKGNKCEDLQ